MKKRLWWKARTNVDRAFMFKFLTFLHRLDVAKEETNELWRYGIQGMIKN